MSIDLATFQPVPDDPDATRLSVTAYYGGEKYGRCVQLTVGNGATVSYAQLSEQQCIRLAALLLKRVTEVLDETANEEIIAP